MPQEIIESDDMEPARPKPKYSKLAKASGICALISIPMYLLTNVVLEHDNELLGHISAGVFTILFLGSFFLSLIALIIIYRCDEQLGGKNLARLVLSLVSIMIFIFGLMPVASRCTKKLSLRILCATNMHGLGKCITIYAEDHNDVLPDPNHWCDILVEEVGIVPKSFICRQSEAEEGLSSYALNRNVIGYRFSELPPDIVILFETQPGWNMVGEPGNLACYHERGCNILFADGYVEYVKAEKIPKLRWKVEGKEIFPDDYLHKIYIKPQQREYRPSLKTRLITSIAIWISVLAVGIGLLVKFRFVKSWKRGILFTLFVLIGGFLLGFICELYYQSPNFSRIGIIAGGYFGLLAGLVLWAYVTNAPDWLKGQESFKRYCGAVGMLTGVFCSIFIHLTMMIIYQGQAYGLAGGLPFGLAAGWILGRIAGAMVTKEANTQKVTSSDAQ